MAVVSDETRQHFPVRRLNDIVSIFRSQLISPKGPNLALLSILAGYVENQLTCHRSGTTPTTNVGEDQSDEAFPTVELSTIEALYCKFESQIKGAVDLTQFGKSRFASRELVKRVSDVIWGSLTRSYYKDRAHLQSLYSFLTGSKLDCFGVAFAVVAACQLLHYEDVHLALSEDHAWVVFGKTSQETAEVTWHGKGNEDKRGQPVSSSCTDKSWLYLNGHPVHCSRFTEVGALVSSINPSINTTTDSTELAALQQHLLWLLYDQGHLNMYPMALGNLGDLEEVCPSPGRPPPLVLFQEAVQSARTHYGDHHVYPYTYLGGYLYRNGRYKEALNAWADAANVIRKFNYSREDEEIYKEFLEIANELIPHIVKVVQSGSGCEPSGLCTIPLLQDAQCLASLLRFYDGLCAWEEDSPTPVLHIGWAKPLVATIGKFSPSVRSSVEILVNAKDEVVVGSASKTVESQNGGGSAVDQTDNVCLKSLVQQLDQHQEEAPHPNIATLAAACGDSFFNPDYLLGSPGEPFSPASPSSAAVAPSVSPSSGKSNGLQVEDLLLKAENNNHLSQAMQSPRSLSSSDSASVSLSSQKMAGLRELLRAEKLNTSAIQLQLTAQSQVHLSKRPRTHSTPNTNNNIISTAPASSGELAGVGSTTPNPDGRKRSRRD